MLNVMARSLLLVVLAALMLAGAEPLPALYGSEQAAQKAALVPALKAQLASATVAPMYERLFVLDALGRVNKYTTGYFGIVPTAGGTVDLTTLAATVSAMALLPETADLRPVSLVVGDRTIATTHAALFVHFRYTVTYAWTESGPAPRQGTSTHIIETHHLLYPPAALDALISEFALQDAPAVMVNGSLFPLK